MRRIKFPVYLLGGAEGVLVASVRGHECVLLFDTRERAIRHIQENKDLEGAGLEPVEVPDAPSLRRELRGLPEEITCVLWNVTLQPPHFKFTDMSEMLKSCSDR